MADKKSTSTIRGGSHSMVMTLIKQSIMTPSEEVSEDHVHC